MTQLSSTAPRHPILTRTFRVGWILLRLLAVLWLAQRGEHFYYQGF